MNEFQLKNELIKLEKQILDITGNPLDQKHDCQFPEWIQDRVEFAVVTKFMSDRCFLLNLLFETHCTPEEVARLENINGMLLEMTNRTYNRTAEMVRTLMVMKKDDMDDDYELEGKLVPRFDIPYSVLHLEDDNYYGSDFIRMAAILQETEKHKPVMVDVYCDLSRLKEKTPSATDKELKCSNDLDDGYSWAEGPLRHPKLSHITICHAFHALCTHMNWSIPDVLRLNDFSIEFKLSVQQFFYQKKNLIN